MASSCGVLSTTVRLATLSDLAKIAKNNVEMAWETEKLALSLETVTAGVERILVSDPCTGGATYYVAEVDGAVAGQLMVRGSAHGERVNALILLGPEQKSGLSIFSQWMSADNEGVERLAMFKRLVDSGQVRSDSS